MSPRRRLTNLFDHALLRRIVTIGSLLLAFGVGLILSPVLLVAAFVLDLVHRDARRPRTRIVVLLLAAMGIEVVGLIRLFFFWVQSGFGRRFDNPLLWHRQRGLIGWYTNTLFAVITWVLGTKVIWRDHADLASGPVVLIARHTSFFDALIPAIVLARRSDLLVHHVVTRGLRFSPCIDIFGHRFPNRFISRVPTEAGSEVGAIVDIGKVLDDRSGAIIFPEGTFRTSRRFERALASIRRRSPELAERATEFRHVLPPRPRGTQALLTGAPRADVVVCTNTGLEPFGSLKAIITAPVAEKPITIETWRIPRASLPDVEDDEAFTDWMFDEYKRIDQWVADQQ